MADIFLCDEAGRVLHAGTGPGFFKSFGAQPPQQPQQPQPGADEHPSVVGKGDFGGQHPGKADKMKFGGRQYSATGKSGNSLHDKTPVREFQADDGHKVWGDEAGRVHAHSKSEVPQLRQLAQGGGAPQGAQQPGQPGQQDQQPQQGQQAGLQQPNGAPMAPQGQQGSASPSAGQNPLSKISSKALGQAVKGKTDLNKHAKVALTSRGLDSSGQWVGVAKAKAHHGVSDKDLQHDPSNEVAGQFQNVDSDSLGAAARGDVDLNAQAKQELADRGHDADGNWVGVGGGDGDGDEGEGATVGDGDGDEGDDDDEEGAPAGKPGKAPLSKALFFVARRKS